MKKVKIEQKNPPKKPLKYETLCLPCNYFQCNDYCCCDDYNENLDCSQFFDSKITQKIPDKNCSEIVSCIIKASANVAKYNVNL